MRSAHNPRMSDTTIVHHAQKVASILSDGSIKHAIPQTDKIGKLVRRKRVGFALIMTEGLTPLKHDDGKEPRKRKELVNYKFSNSDNYKTWLTTQNSFRALKAK